MSEQHTEEPRGRFLQTDHAESDVVEGQRLRELVAVRWDGGPAATQPNVIQLRTDGPHWLRFFLDAGTAFWEEWEDEDIVAEREDAATCDLGVQHGLVGLELGPVVIVPGPKVHLHFADGRRLTLASTDPKDLDAEPELTVESGDVQTSYRELLHANDEPGHYEWPADHDWKRHRRLVKECGADIASALGIPLEVDDQVQDASFTMDLILKATAVGNVIHQQAVRFSNFGDMATVTDPDVDAEVLRAVRRVLTTHGFVFVPPDLLDEPYDGVLAEKSEIRTWWIRYFDYL